MTNKRASITVTGTTDQPTREFQKLAAAQDKAAESLRRYIEAARKQNQADRFSAFDRGASSIKQSDALMAQFSRTTSGLGAAFRTAGLAAGAFVAVGAAAAGAIGDLAERGMAAQGVMNNLPFAIDSARTATRGLISDFELAKSANTLVSFGVVKTSDDFAKLAQAAQNLGIKLGQSAQSTMESLSAALGRNSKLMLDNLGIILSIPQAEERYAKSLNKTVKELTDNEKAEAFRKEAMKEIFKAAQDVTVATDGAAAAVQRFSVELENMKDRALGAERPTISLKQGIEKLSQEQRKLIGESRLYGSSLDQVRDALRDQGVATSELTSAYQPYIDALAEVVAAEQKRFEWTSRSNKTLHDSAYALGQATKIVNDYAGKTIRAERLKDIEREIAALGDSRKAQEHVNTLLAEKAEITAFQHELSGEQEKADKIRFDEELRQLRSEAEHTGATTKKVKELSQAWIEAYNAMVGGQLSRSGSDTREIAAATREAAIGRQIDAVRKMRRSDILQEAEDRRAANDVALKIKLDALEAEQAAGVDYYSMADRAWIAAQRERDAKLYALEEERRINAEVLSGRERMLAMEDAAAQRRQILHQAELARIAKEMRERERWRGRMEQVTTAVSRSHQGMATAIIGAAFSSSESVRGAVKHFAQSKAQEMTILAATEAIQAVASAALGNYPAAAQHGTAAGLAAAEAAGLGALYGGLSGGTVSVGKGGGFGSAFGPGSEEPATGSPRAGSVGQGPPVSRPSSAQPLPPAPRGGNGKTVIVNFTSQSLFPPDQHSQITALRRALAQAEREDGDVH